MRKEFSLFTDWPCL